MLTNLQLKAKILLFSISLLAGSLVAQDIHFSQFDLAPMQLSPALTGVFAEDIRFVANYRRQWKSVPVDYLTFSGAVDGKLAKFSHENGFFSVGGVFNYDVAGDGNLTYSQFGGTVSYIQKMSEQQLVSIGLLMGAGQRRIDMNNLTFGAQFNGDVFVETASNRENLDQTSVFYLDIGTGVNWHLQEEDQRYWADAGIGIFHLNQPDVGFYENSNATLSRKYSIYGTGGFEISSKLAILFNAYFQKQSPYTESVAGGGIRYQMMDQRGRELAIKLGTSYRFIGSRDAIIPNIAVYYNAWIFGFSYDVNLSDFEIATNKRGGPELALQHRITKVKPPKATKVCPIF